MEDYNLRSQALAGAMMFVAFALLVSIKSAKATEATNFLDDPAVITDNSRNPPFQVDDFLRLVYVPASIPVTTPGTPSQKRSFFGDTRFYMPPISSAQIIAYAGSTVNDNADLVAMRCRPSNQSVVDPGLAIWPNLARFVQQDFPPTTCPASSGASTQAKAYCLSQQFQDTPNDPLRSEERRVG